MFRLNLTFRMLASKYLGIFYADRILLIRVLCEESKFSLRVGPPISVEAIVLYDHREMARI